MAEPIRFPYGYARPPGGGPQGMGTMLTWEGMMTKSTVRLLHPEVRRRFHALISDAAWMGVPLGCGTGWRVQPNPPPPGFASPGNSYHESFPAGSGDPNAMAIDTVPNISWDWLEAHASAYGFRTFRHVNNEPWHIQPFEVPTSRNWATVAPPLMYFTLPGQHPPVVTPPADERTFPVSANLPVVQRGSTGGFSRKCQALLNSFEMNQGREPALIEDGNFGQHSEAVLILTQTRLGLTADGKCGPNTWTALLER